MAVVRRWSQIEHFQPIKSEFRLNLPYLELMRQTTPSSGSFVTSDSNQQIDRNCTVCPQVGPLLDELAFRLRRFMRVCLWQVLF